MRSKSLFNLKSYQEVVKKEERDIELEQLTKQQFIKQINNAEPELDKIELKAKQKMNKNKSEKDINFGKSQQRKSVNQCDKIDDKS